MNKEIQYSSTTDKKHLKKYGQYFTPDIIATFMVKWCGKDGANFLDPAVGNGIFISKMHEYFRDIKSEGFEIDYNILNFFQSNKNYSIHNEDFLLSTFKNKYDSIVCNPPYNKFQKVNNRQEIIDYFEDETGLRFTLYSNQYVYFLYKCLLQLNNKGRLAFIIPSEFLNSKFGEQIKEYFLKNKILKAVINLDYSVFETAITTSCILLVENQIQPTIDFINVNEQDMEKLDASDLKALSEASNVVSYNEINAKEKWSNYFKKQDSYSNYKNLVNLSQFAKVSRGIATGANNFFILNKSLIEHNNISEKFLEPCITSSTQVKDTIFTSKSFNDLVIKDKRVFLLDIKGEPDTSLEKYIKYGEEIEVNKKYLPSKRNPWYSMEQGEISPIWLSSAFRENIKVIRNIAKVKNLTTFHGLKIYDEFSNLIDILFCYLLTDVGQDILKNNTKSIGGGLNKFQPSDYNNSKVLDLRVLSDSDVALIKSIYLRIVDKGQLIPKHKDILEDIFKKYIY